MDGVVKFCNSVNQFFYYISHPKETGTIVWNFIDHESYYVCILVCLVALAFYLCGWEKGKKVTCSSVLVYILIRMLSTAF
jgi:hypothetical protein